MVRGEQKSFLIEDHTNNTETGGRERIRLYRFIDGIFDKGLYGELLRHFKQGRTEAETIRAFFDYFQKQNIFFYGIDQEAKNLERELNYGFEFMEQYEPRRNP